MRLHEDSRIAFIRCGVIRVESQPFSVVIEGRMVFAALAVEHGQIEIVQRISRVKSAGFCEGENGVFPMVKLGLGQAKVAPQRRVLRGDFQSLLQACLSLGIPPGVKILPGAIEQKRRGFRSLQKRQDQNRHRKPQSTLAPSVNLNRETGFTIVSLRAKPGMPFPMWTPTRVLPEDFS